MKTLTYGRLPSVSQFEKAFEEERGSSVYRLKLGASDSRAADGTSIGDGDYTARELLRGLKELVEKGDDPALDLAGAILFTLGFEWV